SSEHLEQCIRTNAESTGYTDGQGQERVPHQLIMLEVHASWCRACMGVTKRYLKLCAANPQVLCLKLNKGDHQDVAAKLGVRGLPTFVLYKNGKRIDHFTTTDQDTMEEAILDNTTT
ncbi:unnamed protein product, partial [Chrysoparadoxa australica]